MRLENWYITDNNDGFKAPELIRKFANGEIYNHPDFPNGDHIRTSWLKELNLTERYVITANGSRYELGTPDVEYAKQFGL